MAALLVSELIVETLAALALLLVPGALFGPAGLALDAAATTMARLFGSAVLTLPVLLWFALRSGAPQFQRAMVYGLAVYNVAVGALLASAVLGGQLNTLGWAMAGAHAFFFAWCGYVVSNLARQPSAVRRQRPA